MLLATPVLLLLWQVKLSTLKKIFKSELVEMKKFVELILFWLRLNFIKSVKLSMSSHKQITIWK